MSSPSHLASDSDSEVYCDSVDQFGQEEVRASSSTQQLELIDVDDFFRRLQNSEHNRSPDGLDDEENQVSAPVEESRAEQEFQEDDRAPPQVVRCGGEDGENGGAMAPRQRFNADGSSSSVVRRGRGETLAGLRLRPSSSRSPQTLRLWRPSGSKSPSLGSGNMEPLHSTGGGGGGRWGGAAKGSGSLNEQIVVALARLQDDMQSVLERLHTLEALTASQVRPASSRVSVFLSG